MLRVWNGSEDHVWTVRSRGLQIPHLTAHKVLQALFRAHAHKIKIVQNQAQRYAVATDGLLERVVFTEKLTFHVLGIANHHDALETLIL